MAEKERTIYTLWTNPMSNWTKLLEGQESSVEVQNIIKEAVNALDETKVKERIAPYDIPITNSTMSKSVK